MAALSDGVAAVEAGAFITLDAAKKLALVSGGYGLAAATGKSLAAV